MYKRQESILTKDFLINTGYQGVLLAIATVGAFFIGLQTDAMTASTMAFATLCLGRLFHGFNCRAKRDVYKRQAECIAAVLPFTFPSGVIGMILLFLLLLFKFIKRRHIEEVSQFVLKNISFFYIPTAVSIMESVGYLQGYMWQFALILSLIHI